MCGIAGFVGRGDRELLGRMTHLLAHRGPDAQELYVDESAGVHLGHRRLSVIDHAGGQQPMHDDDSALVIVYNGEIYNFVELRAELERVGMRFQSDHSDTEVLLKGYRYWSEDLPSRLNGMWSFVIYDKRRQVLFCSRDRFGKKPLYYSCVGGNFIFASELSAVAAHPDVSDKPDTRALRKYFAYGFVPAPLTLLHDIVKLPAGCSLTYDLRDRAVQVQRYWRYEPAPDANWLKRPDDAVSALGEALDRAVARRLVADVPVGLFLSGGVDSSTVAALAMKHVGRDRLKTFSIGFDEAGFDESIPAATVAQHIGADHRLERLTVAQARQSLPALLSQLDDPIADSSILPTWLLCRHAREEVTVALGGDGADELLSGYDPFKALRYARFYDRFVPGPMHRAIKFLVARLPVSHGYMSFDFRLKRLLRGLDHESSQWLPTWMAPLSRSEIGDLLGEPVPMDEVYSEAIEAWERCSSDDDIDRATCFFVDLYLQDDILVKVDRASMLNSLEVRAPFLDIEVADLVRRFPSELKIRNGQTKWVLKRVAEKLLPHEIVNRRKQGFALPIGRWFAQENLGAQFRVPAQRNCYWQNALVEHRSGHADHRLYLWSEAMLSGINAQALNS